MAGEVAKIIVTIGGDTYQLEQAVGKSKKEINGLSETAKEVGGMLAAFFAVDRLVSFAGSIIAVRSEFEKYSAVLANSLGSQKQSADAMAMLQKFAAQTPYQLTELTDAYVKLINRGLRPSQSELTKVGDFASATGKSFGQLNEAILDANNPERWKEFGVQTKTMGDKVQLTFRGVTVEVERSAAGAMKAVEAFGSLEGISGTMGAQMETLGGKVSNLKDSWDMLLNNLGKTSIWQDVIGYASELVGAFNNLFRGTKNYQLMDEKTTKAADDYEKRLTEQIKKEGDIVKAKELLKDQLEKIQYEQIYYNKLLDDGVKLTDSQKERLMLVNKVYAVTSDMLNNTKSLNKVFGIDDQTTNPLGYIEGLKNKIKELTESIEKAPNDMTLLTSLQTELNKTKKELDEVLLKLATIGHTRVETPELITPKTASVNSKKSKSENPYKALMAEYENDLKQFKKEVLDISQDLNASLAEVFASIAEGIGQALAGGNTTDILKNFIATLGSLMASFGKMLIAWGVAQIALEESISNPYAALAAGAALVIIGSAMSQKSSEITGSQSANYGSKYGGSGRATSEQLTQHVEFDIRGDIIRAIVRNDTKIVQRIR